MHELFLSAFVADADVCKARAIMQGYCGMGGRHSLTRIRYVRQPPGSGIKGLPAIKTLQTQKVPNLPLWQDLHAVTARESYILRVAYEGAGTPSAISPTSSFAPGTVTPAPAVPPGKLTPVVRWTDLPDPDSERKPAAITQRKIMEIRDDNADKILADNKYSTKSESAEECYTWWKDGLEYCLMMPYVVCGAGAAAASAGTAVSSPSIPVTPSGAIDKAQLEPLAHFWMLFVRMRVESSPDRLQHAYAKLLTVHGSLNLLFEFRVFDRVVHDSRNYETAAAPAPQSQSQSQSQPQLQQNISD